MLNKISKIFVISLLVIFMFISVILPVFSLFIKAFYNSKNEFVALENFIEYFSNPNTSSSLLNSLETAFLVSFLVLIISFFFAYAINRTNIKFKKVFNFLAFLPLFAPTMTHAIALIYIFGRQGIVSKFFDIQIPIYGFLGIVLSQIIFIFPVVYLMFGLALKNEDYRKYEVAQLFGVSKIKQFFTITLPSIKFSIITSFFTAFTLSFADFGAPQVIGGNFNVLATDIYKQVIGQQNFAMGSVVGILLILPAFIAFIADFFITNKNSKLSSNALKYKIIKNKKRDFAYFSFNFILGLCIIFMFGVVLLASLVKSWPYNLEFSLSAYKFSVMGHSVYEILANSIFVAFVSAIFGTLISFLMAYFVQRQKRLKVIRKIAYFLSILPNSIPGLSIGLAYIFFFNSNLNPLNFIYGTFAILILANIVHFFATPFLTMSANLKKLDNEFENVSELMNVPWYKLIFRVIAPLNFESILESFSYYFINSMITISAVIFLYTNQTSLLSIMMINKNDSGLIAQAAAMAVLIVAVNIVFKFIFESLIRYIKNYNHNKIKKEQNIKKQKGYELRQNGKEILEILNEISKNTGVKYWLEFGTLLGKIRDNDFINHDINFDIGVMDEELRPEFLIYLENAGFKRILSFSLNNKKLKYLKYEYKNIEIEIFIFERKDDKVCCYSKEFDEVYVNTLSNSTLEEVKFMGVDTFIPRNSIQRLLEIYGKDFNIPNPNWKDEMSPSRAKIKKMI